MSVSNLRSKLRCAEIIEEAEVHVLILAESTEGTSTIAVASISVICQGGNISDRQTVDTDQYQYDTTTLPVKKGKELVTVTAPSTVS